jgi:hypothetical protein
MWIMTYCLPMLWVCWRDEQGGTELLLTPTKTDTGMQLSPLAARKLLNQCHPLPHVLTCTRRTPP